MAITTSTASALLTNKIPRSKRRKLTMPGPKRSGRRKPAGSKMSSGRRKPKKSGRRK